jgi:hypothetical protein
MKKYILLFITVLTVLLYSCDDESFSQVVTIDIPDHTPLPALKLQLTQGDLALSVLVSNSKGILDPESAYDLPDDAEVKLFRNGSELLELTYDPMISLYLGYIPAGISSQAGDIYQLSAKLVGFEEVTAEQVMPPQPLIVSAEYELEGTIDSEGFRVDELIVDIKDTEAGKTNYFGVELYQIYYDIDFNGDTIGVYRSQVGLDSNDPLLEYSELYGLVFNDEGFSGGTYQLRCYTYYSLGLENNLEVEVYQLTEDAFLYARSLSQYYDAIDNPFAEPVTVHSNIEGGYGVFTLANRTVYPID